MVSVNPTTGQYIIANGNIITNSYYSISNYNLNKYVLGRVSFDITCDEIII